MYVMNRRNDILQRDAGNDNLAGIAATKKLNHERLEKTRKISIQLHHERYEVNEVKRGSAGRLTGFMI